MITSHGRMTTNLLQDLLHMHCWEWLLTKIIIIIGCFSEARVGYTCSFECVSTICSEIVFRVPPNLFSVEINGVIINNILHAFRREANPYDQKRVFNEKLR